MISGHLNEADGRVIRFRPRTAASHRSHLGRPRSVIPRQTTHQSQTSRNTNARKASMIIDIAWS
jgi:hypothetical protein